MAGNTAISSGEEAETLMADLRDEFSKLVQQFGNNALELANISEKLKQLEQKNGVPSD